MPLLTGMSTNARNSRTPATETTEKHFLAINRGRLRRVEDKLTPRQRDFLDILPVLFHINHPLLPGYISASLG